MIEAPLDAAPPESAVSGARIARARNEAGLTQNALATRLGVSLWTLHRLERDEPSAPVDADMLSTATGKPASWFEAERGDVAPEAHAEDTRAGGPPADATGARLPAGAQQADQGSPGLGGAGWLIIISIALLVVIRFFTEEVPVLPEAVTFVDVPIFFLILTAAAIRTRKADERGSGATRFLVPAVVFLAVCLVSVVANLSRIAPAPALLFVYGFLGPLAVYYAVYRLWPAGRGLAFSRLLVGLLLLEIAVVGFFSLPRFLVSDNPDEISGTFGENPYQLVFFLLVVAAVLAGTFIFERHRVAARLTPLLVVLILVVIFLAQYRALLVTTALTVLLVFGLLSTLRGRRGVRGALGGILAAVAFTGGLLYVSQAFPSLLFAQALEDAADDPGLYASLRLAPFEALPELYGDDARYAVSGTGAGTYSSRAWRTFYEGSANTGVVGETAAIVNGGRLYRTDVSDEYVVPNLDPEPVQGSILIAQPYSSYVALAAEVGLLGMAAMVAIIVLGLIHAGRMTVRTIVERRPRDPLPGLLLGSTAGFFVLLQMGFLDNWFEVTRISFLAWALLAVATKEFDARRREARAVTGERTAVQRGSR